MTWNPEQYLRFDQHRLRPALELIQRIPLEHASQIVDLGCGTGNVTALLQQRWENAQVLGVDSSSSMLARARQDYPQSQWLAADIQTWQATEHCDLLFSNATLHWLPDHANLFPRLLSMVKTGGVLAIQMPNNFTAPSHTLMMQAARNGRWLRRLKAVLPNSSPVHRPAFYYDLLIAEAQHIEIWETEYWQVLVGDDAVAEWTKGTWLKPLLDALEEPARSQFEQEYRRLLAMAYPQRADGTTLFPFKRLFMVVQK
jgi:trans-aconitate 2-methyltransferase